MRPLLRLAKLADAQSLDFPAFLKLLQSGADAAAATADADSDVAAPLIEKYASLRCASPKSSMRDSNDSPLSVALGVRDKSQVLPAAVFDTLSRVTHGMASGGSFSSHRTSFGASHGGLGAGLVPSAAAAAAWGSSGAAVKLSGTPRGGALRTGLAVHRPDSPAHIAGTRRLACMSSMSQRLPCDSFNASPMSSGTGGGGGSGVGGKGGGRGPAPVAGGAEDDDEDHGQDRRKELSEQGHSSAMAAADNALRLSAKGFSGDSVGRPSVEVAR